MKPRSSHFTVPLTFSSRPSQGGGHAGSVGEREWVDISCSSTQPAILQSWGSWSAADSSNGSESNSRGAIIGSRDGTLYLFHQSTCVNTGQQHQREISQNSRPTSPPYLSRDSPTTPRSNSPCSSAAPFNVTSRSRIVSGITAEQVEAPKNYVDFDDEPEKLKDMLKGKSPRDRPASLELNLEKGVSRGLSAEPTLRRRADPKSLLSATNSPAFTPKSSSAPASPRPRVTISPQGTNDLTLYCHIIPPRSGEKSSVTAIRLLEDNQSFVVLRETGDIFVFSTVDGSCHAAIHVDDVPLQPPVGVQHRDGPHEIWTWQHLDLFEVGESTLIVVSATIDPSAPSPPTIDLADNGALDKSRLAIFEFKANQSLGLSEVHLGKIGQWHFEGPAQALGIYMEDDNTPTFYRITSAGQLIIHSLKLLLPLTVASTDGVLAPDTHISNVASIPLPNPFRRLKSQSTEHLPVEGRQPSRIALGEQHALGNVFPHLDGSIVGLEKRLVDSALLMVVWSETQLLVFKYEHRFIQVISQTKVTGIQSVAWVANHAYAVIFKDSVVVFGIEPTQTASSADPQRLRRFSIDSYDAVYMASASELLITRIGSDGRRELLCGSSDLDSSKSVPRVLWKATCAINALVSQTRTTTMLPIEPGVIIQGSVSGNLCQTNLQELCAGTTNIQRKNTSQTQLNGHIVSLHMVQNPRTKERFLVGGADDGSIAFWALDTLKLSARWIIFTAPIEEVIQFPEEEGGPLHGCVLCISRDGTIAVIAIDGFQFLYLIPGSAFALLAVSAEGDNLLLLYTDHRARVWNLRTKEFWRSVGADKSAELLSKGGWTTMLLDNKIKSSETSSLGIIGRTLNAPDAAYTLALDLERFVSESTAIAKSISTNRDQTRSILSTLDKLRSVLSTVLTPGLKEEIDYLCFGKLGIPTSSVSPGFSSFGTYALFPPTDAACFWCISGDASAMRLLSIITLLRALGLFEELSEAANTVSAFYATSLAMIIGPLFKPPSFVFLARRWFEGSAELRQASRMLFDATVARLSDEDANAIAEQWQHYLPCLQPTAERESVTSGLALFLCGYIAAEKYSLLSPSVLTDISKSITLYLHDEQSLYRVLAIDLCSRGFHVWQHYIDAIEILRALFTLATSSRKENITLQNVAAQARLAVLQIASSNTPLFMTTLSLDILSPLDVDHRRSVMQIVAFLIRKRPLVLQPNLPKLVEAVVKSLDPNSTSHRDAVLDTATEIIGHVVKTFPTIDFHMPTQRLAVGTNEGAIVMYDLKTAIRLYVLEGHKERITACSFSPDGRRLVTLSLEESVVLVWKVGTSFSSFFNPGAPPRQGHSGSQPFKTIPFNVGAEAEMTIAGTLEWVHFEWAGDRNVKLRIRESLSTFST